MKCSADRLAQRLETELGAGTVVRDPLALAARRIDGKEPALLIFPASVEELSAALRVCSEVEATVAPWGGGTAMSIGNAPRDIDVVVGLERLNLLLEHDPANLTTTVQSGHRLAPLQQALAQHNQFLPLDPPAATRATVGGIIAANMNGPRRGSYGSVRDLTIGMKVVLASGEQIKAGGKVVKNVAGYDMCKLFVGSIGTLGIIAEVTLRVAPIPETAATLMISGTLAQAHQFADELSRSKLLPSAFFLLSPEAAPAAGIDQSRWRGAVWFEGFEETVTRYLRDAPAAAQRIGLASAILKENDHRRFWDELRDFALRADRLVYRITVPRSAVAEIIQTAHHWLTDLRPEIVSDAAGVVWISLEVNDLAGQWFAKLMAEARAHRGHVILFATAAKAKEGIDVWGSVPPALSLMREIKRQFDPQNLLNPGRFIGGI